jgi:hypothetical protein
MAPYPNEPEHRRKRFFVLAVHLVLLLITCLIVFKSNRQLLLVGYDGAFYRTTIKNQHEWMPAAPQFGMNPLQGLGNIAFGVNTHYSPGYAASASVGHGAVRRTTMYTVVAFEAFLGVFLLARCLGLSSSVGLFASWVLTLLSLPFLFPAWLYPISGLCPHFIEYSAATAAAIGLFHRVGKHPPWTSLVLALLTGLVLAWMIICSPLNLLLCLPALAWYLCVSILRPESRAECRAKLLTAAALLGIFVPTAIPYFLGNYLYSVPTFFAHELQNDRLQTLWTSVLFHGSENGWFGPILVIGGLLGALVTCFGARGSVRALAASTFVFTLLIIAAGLAATYLVADYRGPSLLYFESALWPFYSLFFSVLLLAAFGWLTDRLLPLLLVRLLLGTRLRCQFVACLPFAILPAICFVNSFHEKEKSSYFPYPFPPSRSAIVRSLEDAIALHPDSDFRGLAATFTGFQERNSGASWIHLQSHDGCFTVATGNDHRAMGLWYHGIPTLHEYSQLMSPTYYLMMSRLLARPQDLQVRTIMVLTRVNIDYLRSLGVRFIVTDFDMPNPFLRLVSTLAAANHTIHLYELPEPNLGTYSPTEVTVSVSARDTVERMQEPGFDFARQAIAAHALPANLVPASFAQLAVKRDRWLVRASSQATSLLLLPLQYSHCLSLRIRSATGQTPTLERLNLMQAGLLFSGTIEAEISFGYGPLRRPYGRIQDYLDMRQLHLAETERTRGQPRE